MCIRPLPVSDDDIESEFEHQDASSSGSDDSDVEEEQEAVPAISNTIKPAKLRQVEAKLGPSLGQFGPS